MPTASYVKIPAAIEDIVETGNAGTDQWAIALTNTVPGSKAFTAGTTDLATGGGYTQGGANVTTSFTRASSSSLWTWIRWTPNTSRPFQYTLGVSVCAFRMVRLPCAVCITSDLSQKPPRLRYQPNPRQQ